MTQVKVLVLLGGSSDERDISLRSGRAVVVALTQAGYAVEQLDPAKASTAELVQKLRAVDVVFPVLHGAGGEDGTVQTLLEVQDVSFVGAGSAASRICFDKWQYKKIIDEAGVPSPHGELVTADSIEQSTLSHSPFVLKPYDGGSSVDTFICRDPATADTLAIRAALARHTKMLQEELIVGHEITVGVLGSTALPVIEIIPPADGEFDYDNKYNGKSAELCPPRNIDASVQKQAQALALQIHQLLQIDDLSRTDFMVQASDNALFVLETNTLPGMTDQSLYPKAAAAAGYTMPQLVDRLVQTALSRKRRAELLV